MENLSDPERFDGERVEISISKESYDRLLLVRQYIETSEEIDETTKTDLLDRFTIEHLADHAVDAFLEGFIEDLFKITDREK